jgi:hypothetical protein
MPTGRGVQETQTHKVISVNTIAFVLCIYLTISVGLFLDWIIPKKTTTTKMEIVVFVIEL